MSSRQAVRASRDAFASLQSPLMALPALAAIWHEIVEAYHAHRLVMVFDMDGTAVDNEFTHRKNLEKIAAANGAGEMQPWPWDILAGQSNAFIHDWVTMNYPGFSLTPDEYRLAFEALYVETPYEANAEIQSLHRHLNARGIVCGINTSTPQHMSRYALAVAGYNVDEVEFLSADMLDAFGKKKKPAPDSYHMIESALASRMSLQDPFCVAFEDTRSGSTAALATHRYRLIHLLDDPTQRLSEAELAVIHPTAHERYFPMTRDEMGAGIRYLMDATQYAPRHGRLCAPSPLPLG